MHSSLVVAQSILNFAKKDGIYLSGGKLHKLVYFAQAIHLAAFGGRPLIDEKIKAWNFGPLVPELYNLIHQYGNKVLPYELPLIGITPIDKASSEYTSIISTWSAYKDVNDAHLKLVSTLKGTPWHQVWSDEYARYGAIPEHVIQAYYANQLRPGPKSEPVRSSAADRVGLKVPLLVGDGTTA